MEKLRRFIRISMIVILLSVAIAYKVQAINPPYDGFNFNTFINDGPNEITLKGIILGLTFGTVLGFVDTIGIWIGVDQISSYISGGEKIKSAVANMYSNIMGISFGTVVSVIMGIVINTDNNQTPLYLTLAGSIIGSTLGIVVGNTFL